ncbi:MAG: RIP metalloprotease RseP [Acholeplasmataceae bacterium]|nr:RIP metalloprotease RseP [Acholeplasmataceae bacterium]
MFLLNLIVFVLVLGVIILIHELGHFYFAKKSGILCHEFSIGMGPALYQKRKGETIYSVRAIPIGGYVSMAGESITDALIKKTMVIGVQIDEMNRIKSIVLNEETKSDLIGAVIDYDLYGKDQSKLFITLDIQGEQKTLEVLRDAIYIINEKKQMWITPEEKSFESKTLSQRFMVIFAGPLMNFILAFLLFLIVGFFAFKPNLDSNVVDSVAELSPAHAIGLEAEDQITMIDGNVINSWTDLSNVMQSIDKVSFPISFTRAGTVYNKDVTALVIIQMAGITNAYVDGVYYSDAPIIGQTFGRAQSEAGLESQDLIVSFEANGMTYPILNWNDILLFFRDITSGSITINYIRDGILNETTYDLISQNALEKLGHQPILVQLGVTATSDFNLGYTLIYPFRMVYDNTMQVLNTIGLLFSPSEKLGVGDLSGPIGIFTLVSQTRSQGFLAIVSFTAFLSINIGLLNLLPIPALDGGRLVFLGIEAVTRKPLNKRIENMVNQTMFILLMVLFVFVTYNDIIRLIKG